MVLQALREIETKQRIVANGCFHTGGRVPPMLKWHSINTDCQEVNIGGKKRKRKQATGGFRAEQRTVREALPDRSEGEGHEVRPGDYVMVRSFQRSSSLEPRWRGPEQILLATRTAVRVTNRRNWIHSTHCKKVPSTLVEPAALIDHHEILDTEKGQAVSPERSEEVFPDHTIPGASRYELRSRRKAPLLERTG